VTMNRYVAVVVAAFSGIVALGIVNRLHSLGGWSTPADLVGSIILVVVAGAALYLGTKRDKERDRANPDSDY